LNGLKKRFKIISTSKQTSEFTGVAVLLEAKQLWSVNASEFRASLFDKDKVRIDILGDSGGSMWIEGGIPKGIGVTLEVNAGERLRVIFRLPAKTTWQRVRYVVIGSDDIPRD
jgi:hypothetical protein